MLHTLWSRGIWMISACKSSVSTNGALKSSALSAVGFSQHMLDITRVMTGSFVQSPSQPTVLHVILGHRELNHKHILFL